MNNLYLGFYLIKIIASSVSSAQYKYCLYRLSHLFDRDIQKLKK